MANHPNRAQVQPKADPAVVLEMAGRLVANASLLLQTAKGSPEYDRALRAAIRSAQVARQSLQMLKPPATP